MFRKIISTVLSFAILSSSVVFASPDIISAGPVTLIVETEGEPALVNATARSFEAKKKAETLAHDQDAVINSIRSEVTSDVKKGYTYTSLFNGFSIETDSSYIDEIKSLPGVVDVYISGTSHLPKEQLASSGDMIGTTQVYNSGYHGEGQAIAVIDAGLQWDHEMFSHEPQDAKYSKDDIDSLLQSNSLNAGSYITTVYKNKKIPFAYNYADGNGDVYYPDEPHGTHVSSIACGKGGLLLDGSQVSGIAPEAQLLFFGAGDMYGSFFDADVLAALNDAAALGVDVINMSFGLAYSDSKIKSLYSNALDAARASGIYLMGAAGNDSRGYMDAQPSVNNIDYGTAATSALYESVTAVASANNSKELVSGYNITIPENTEIFVTPAFDGSDFYSIFTRTLEYVDCGYGSAEEIAATDVEGKVALIKRGQFSFITKAENAKAAGAIGLILVNDSEEPLNTVELCLPALVVSMSDGETLYNAEYKYLIGISPAVSFFPLTTASQPSFFTSWGVDSTLNLKPEIMAPGGNIYAASTQSQYAIMSGTSMATPHMSGVMALLNQYYKTNPFSADYNGLTGDDKISLFENIVMSTADVIYQPDGVPYSPRQQGAGLINLESAMKTGVILTGPTGKTKINLGENLTNTLDISFDITNLTNTTHTYSPISVEVMTDGYLELFGENLVEDPVSLTVTSHTLDREITLEPKQKVSVSATITLDEEELLANSQIFENGFFIDGYVILDGATPLSIPFTGFYGDWQSAPAFDSTIYDENGSTLFNPDDEQFSGTFLFERLTEPYYEDRILGKNPTNGNIISSNLIAVNPNTPNQLGFNMQNMRLIEKLIFNIKDENETLIRTSLYTGAISKFTPQTLMLNDWATKDIADGSYTLEISADIDCNGTVDDMVSFPIVYDSKNPEIVSASYASGKLTVSASDNHAVSQIRVIYPTEDGYETAQQFGFDTKEAEKTFDIGDVDLHDVTIVATDYANNQTSVTAYYYAHDISPTVTAFYSDKYVTTLSLLVRNNTETTYPTNVIQAFYDKDGRFLAAGMDPKNLVPGETDVNHTTLEDLTSATTLKIMFINSEKPLSPYRDVFLANIEQK